MEDIIIVRDDGSVLKCIPSKDNPNAYTLTLNGQEFNIMEKFEEIMNERSDETL